MSEFFEILNEYAEKNKNDILIKLKDLEKKQKKLYAEIKKITRIKSAEELFYEWRLSYFIYIGSDFQSFIECAKRYIK